MSIEKPSEKHPFLKTYTHPVKKAERAIIGREKEMNSILAAFQRPELCNVILLGDAGSGKTALVQGTMLHDKKRLYLEVDLSKMIADLTDNNQMADRLKQLFNEVMECVREDGREIVLFMDEFHQVVQLSAAAQRGAALPSREGVDPCAYRRRKSQSGGRKGGEIR
jgi:ATP-dependent Clp protease ATP-binding subunit ClpA